MWLQRSYTVPKVGDVPNEDRFASSDRTFALSDGASISYDSALWAQIICTHYIDCQHITPEWVSACAAEFNTQHQHSALPWYKEEALARGSFASLLGVQVAENEIQIAAIGDSIAVLCDGTVRKDTFPYRNPEQFEQAPLLLSTVPTKNPFFSDGGLAEDYVCRWPLEGLQTPRLFCMTDALGLWLLSSEEADPISRLLALDSEESFADFVVAEREAGRLRRDDTTLLVLW